MIFIAGSIYNKSESKIYHPLIGKKIVLPNDVYIVDGFDDDKFDSSFLINQDYNEKYIKLKKGTIVRIVAFIRKSNLLSDTYYVALNIPVEKKQIDQISRNPKKYYKGYPLFWANNFFDSIKILNNGVVKQYSLTLNILFIIIYYVYPFVLLYLLMNVSYRYFHIFEEKYSINPIDLILYAIAYYYVLMAALNDGFSGYLLGVPYAVFLVYDLISFKSSALFKFLHLSILTIALFFIVYDRSSNALIYPSVGKSYTVSHDVNYTYGDYYINQIDILSKYDHESKGREVFTLQRNDHFSIQKQILTGNPDFGTSYIFEIVSNRFKKMEKYIQEYRDRVEKELYENHRDSFQYRSGYYTYDKTKFYIDGYSLRHLLSDLGYKKVDLKNRFDNGFVYFSFYLFIYPIILGLFVMLIGYRLKNQQEITHRPIST